MPQSNNRDRGSERARAITAGADPLWPPLLRFTAFLGTALLCWVPALLIVYWLVR